MKRIHLLHLYHQGVIVNLCCLLLVSFPSIKLLSQPTLYQGSLSAPAGSTLNISGTNTTFSTVPSDNIVYFGGVRANVLSATTTNLSVTVPAGSFYAPITVTNSSHLTTYSYIPFYTNFQDNASPTLALNSFEGKIDLPTGAAPSGISSGDFNGDGKPDIAVVNATDNTLSIYQNAGNPESISFSPKVDFPTSTGPNNVSVADIDGDGKLDIVIANASGNTVSVFRNTTTTQTISFASAVNFISGNTPYMCALNDFDADGKTDIAVVNRSSDNTVSVLRNTSTVGQISFAAKFDFPTGNFPIAIACGDLNWDQKPDLAIVNYFSNTVSTLRNNCTPGVISFGAKVDFNTGANPIGIAICDMNKDYNQDLVVANGTDNTVSILPNAGSVNNYIFYTKSDFPTGTGPIALALNDMDGDGKVDVVAANQGINTISVLKNITDPVIQIPTLSAKLDFATGSSPSQLFTADFDLDGRPDIATVNFTAKTVSIIRSKAGDGSPVVNAITPQAASSGQTVNITGKSLSGVNSIVFGGTKVASYSILNDSTITAVLGIGAKGKVIISSPTGDATFTGFNFIVDPGPLRIINKVAGNYSTGYGGDGGSALNAQFNNLFALSIDTASGNVYITDGNNFRMRKLNVSNGVVTTIAGTGTAGFSGDAGLATAAQIQNEQGGSAFDKFGHYYFADMSNRRIRKIDTATGIITTVAGGGATNADGILATTATLGTRGVVVDASGNLYIADNTHGKIRKVDALTGLISTVAGTGVNGYNGDSILAVNAQLNFPQNLAIDKAGNIYIADLSNYRIRKVDISTGMITTVIGNGTAGSEGDGGLGSKAQINSCWSVALDTAGNIYVAEANGNRVRRLDAVTGIITTIAGNGLNGLGGDGGNALSATLSNPTGIAVDKKGNIYTSSASNAVRKISFFNTDVSVCPNGSTSFSSDVFGTSYNWQYDGGSNGAYFIDISISDNGFVGVKTANMSIPMAYTFLNGWQFRCVVNGVPGKTFTLKISETWNGSANSAWENAANWNCNTVPDNGTDVFINSGAVIINSNASCRSLTVKPGASVTVNAGFTLTVNH